MTNTKEKILKNIGQAINSMDDSNDSYLIGFSEGLAFKTKIEADKEGEEDEADK